MKLVLMGTNDFVVPVFDDLSNKYEMTGSLSTKKLLVVSVLLFGDR